MKRSVIQLAGKTLVVSLPSQWARANRIVKGGELNVEMHGSTLLVSTSAGEKAKAAIDISGFDSNLVWYAMIGLYRKGIDEIEVTFANSTVYDVREKSAVSTADLLTRICDRLLGYGVVRQGRNYAVIRAVSEAKREEFESALKRIFMSLIATTEDIATAAKNNDAKTLQNISKYSDNNINKLVDFCIRIINKTGMEYSMMPLLIQLEQIGDELSRKAAEKPDKKRTEPLYKVVEFLRAFYNATFEPSGKNLLLFSKAKKEINNTSFSAIGKMAAEGLMQAIK